MKPERDLRAQEIRELRERIGIDRATFAWLVGVDMRTIFRWESGEVAPQGPAKTLLAALQSANPRTVAICVEGVRVGALAELFLMGIEAFAGTKKSRKRR